jgi:hypothetical protein
MDKELQKLNVDSLVKDTVYSKPIWFDEWNIILPAWHSVSENLLEKLVKWDINTLYCSELEPAPASKLRKMDEKWISGQLKADDSLREAAEVRFYRRLLHNIFMYQERVFFPLIQSGEEILKNAYSQLLDRYTEFNTQPVLKLIQDLDKVPKHDGFLIWLTVLQPKTNVVIRTIFSALYAMLLAPELGLNKTQIYDLVKLTFFRDLAMMQIPGEDLRPPLSQEMKQKISKHPITSGQILAQKSNYTKDCINGIFQHQEWFDGTGYPSKMTGINMLLIAKIFQISEFFSLQLFNLPQRKAFPPPLAILNMVEKRGTMFDPHVLKEFIKIIGNYPVSSPIHLRDKRIAIVVHCFPDNLSRPLVRIIRFKDGTSPVNIKMLNLLFEERVVIREGISWIDIRTTLLEKLKEDKQRFS